jgi:GT2 family glycosyltransferase
MKLTIVIPTYNREQVLVDTIHALIQIRGTFAEATELLVIDQTLKHHRNTEIHLRAWDSEGAIRWLRLNTPHLTHAMNTGLFEAIGEVVLFLDDDIMPLPELLEQHCLVHQLWPEAWAVVGMVLQPGQSPAALKAKPNSSSLWRDLDFPYNSIFEGWVENVMAGNLSVKRKQAIGIGGFDESFPPPVASRFETEFAKRLIRSGGRIRYAPSAAIHHLAATSGGTRSQGSHLTSFSPCHGVGDCYFALRCGRGWERIWYLVRKPFREVRTRFHLRHPWWIPVKLVGEVRALIQAYRLWRKPAKLISQDSAAAPLR